MKHVIKLFGIRIPLLTRKIHEDDKDLSQRNNLTQALVCMNRHNRCWFWKLLHIRREIVGYQTPHERAATRKLPRSRPV